MHMKTARMFAPLTLTALAVPAMAQPAADATALKLSVQQRFGETVYCLPESRGAIEAGCFTKHSWRKRGIEIQLPAQADGTVLAQPVTTLAKAAQD